MAQEEKSNGTLTFKATSLKLEETVSWIAKCKSKRLDLRFVKSPKATTIVEVGMYNKIRIEFSN